MTVERGIDNIYIKEIKNKTWVVFENYEEKERWINVTPGFLNRSSSTYTLFLVALFITNCRRPGGVNKLYMIAEKVNERFKNG